MGLRKGSTTFVDQGMMFEERGKTRAIWTDYPQRIKRRGTWILIAFALLFVMAVTEVKVPLLAVVGPWLVFGIVGYRMMKAPPKTTRESPQRVTEPRTRPVPVFGTADYIPASERRIGDAERDAAIAELTEHYAAGRLDRIEFDTRSGDIIAAKFAADLVKPFEGLARQKGRNW